MVHQAGAGLAPEITSVASVRECRTPHLPYAVAKSNGRAPRLCRESGSSPAGAPKLFRDRRTKTLRALRRRQHNDAINVGPNAIEH